MTENPSTHKGTHNLPTLTVSEISLALKSTVEESFARVRVKGEVSGFKRAASGHLYFSLKDADAVLDGICWRGTAGRLGLNPEDGMEVVATGRLTTYPGRSKYQIVVERMELAGEGALLKLLEERKRKLAQEGLFNEERKQPLPFLPDVIGVITSPTGAVIRDILHRLNDRFPRRVLLWPVLVQGTGAAGEIALAVEGFNRLPAVGPVPRPDLLIVARGGGSLEDLWPFNDEAVVRAAAGSAIPLISAVGHETDTTLIDFAADRRAPTASAAAEMAVPVRIELLAQVMDDGARLVAACNRLLNEQRLRLESLSRGLPNLGRMAEEAAQRLDDWAERLSNSLKVGLDHRRARIQELAARIPSPVHKITHARSRIDGETRALRAAFEGGLRDRRARFEQAQALLESFSHQRVLERGFTLVRDRAGRAIRSVRSLTAGMELSVLFHDGEAGVTVNQEERGPRGERPSKHDRQKPLRKRSRKSDDRQGKLW